MVVGGRMLAGGAGEGTLSDERLDYAVLISLATREEAEVMAGALRADGVDAFVGNANHATANWFYTLAFGGLQVLAPRNRLDDARALIRERLRDNAEAYPEEKVSRRDRWKLWVIVLLLYGATAGLMFLESMPWPPADKYNWLEWIGGVGGSGLVFWVG